MITAQNTPLILVDVDDTLNLIGFSSAARRHLAFHHGWRRGKAWSGGREYQLLVNPAHGRLLRELAAVTGAQLAWATTLEEAANRYVAPLLGLPALPVVTPAPAGEKAPHVVPWTDGRPWVWLDNDKEELATASRLARAAGQPHLCVAVNPATGLTARRAELPRAWLAGKHPAKTAGRSMMSPARAVTRHAPGPGRAAACRSTTRQHTAPPPRAPQRLCRRGPADG